MWPDFASSRSTISSSITLKVSTEISRSCAFRISTKRDMWVPLNWWGRPTYMLNVATVLCAPPERSATLIGWRIALIPTWSMASLRVSSDFWTSGMASGSRVFMKSLSLGWARYWTILTCVPFPSFQDGSVETRPDRRHDPGPVQSDRGEQLRLVAVIDEAIGQAELQQRRHDGAPGERLRHRAPGSPGNRVLLDRDQDPVGRGELAGEIRIHRLHEAHVGDGCVELLRGFERGLEQAAERADGDTTLRASPAHDPLADGQRLHFLRHRRARAAAARIAHRRRPAERECRIQHLAAFI